MPVDVVIPAVGESITEGTLVRWLKKDGELVAEGDALFELETDKATSEITAPATGRLRIAVAEGETVAVGATVGRIDESAAPARKSPRDGEPSGTDDSATRPARLFAAAADSSPARPAIPSNRAAETSVLSESRKPAVSEGAKPVPPEEKGAVGATGVHSGPVGDSTRQPMSRIRKTIAQRLVSAQKNAAILTTFNEADMSQVLDLRRLLKERFQEKHGVALGLMSFFLKASATALNEFPLVNAQIDGDDIVQYHRRHIGVAVSTERGLVVPVIRDADGKSFAELEKEVAGFAAKAREGKISVEDLQGGTFTITNGGVFGSLLSTPLLNPPQTAILGMHAIHKRPIVVQDQVVVRPMMYLALSYDHRLIDGREAVLFLARIKELVERPDRLLLGL
jgi:2-oxoglutarate dehydrogenase E2 component (dihydrolipoamide succinyltransferase)